MKMNLKCPECKKDFAVKIFIPTNKVTCPHCYYECNLDKTKKLGRFNYVFCFLLMIVLVTVIYDPRLSFITSVILSILIGYIVRVVYNMAAIHIINKN